MKKGRHRRFEEARKLKQSGPGAFDLGLGGRDEPSSYDSETSESSGSSGSSGDDEYAALAAKYGVEFDDDDTDTDDD